MTTWLATVLPPWAIQGLYSLLAVTVAYLLGQIVRHVVTRKLAAWARRTTGRWDDAVTAELSRRIPLWSVLLGVYLAAGLWPLPPHVAGSLNNLLFVLVAASVTFFVAGVAVHLTREFGRQIQGDLAVTTLSQNVARILVSVLGLLIILNGLGVSITPILTALGVGGLAVALALQDTLANLFAGFYVTLARQVRVGDYVRLESGDEGYVVDIAWRAAQIRTLPGNLILVPNSRLAQSIVTNYHLPDTELAVLVNLGVDYDSDLAHVERVTCDVAREVLRTASGGVEAFDPFIRYHTFGDSSINFTVILRAREFVDQYLVKHEFVKRLHDRYRREGITIPFPIRTIVARPGGSGPARERAA
jgi:small-conductance mechanosensitive channel